MFQASGLKQLGIDEFVWLLTDNRVNGGFSKLEPFSLDSGKEQGHKRIEVLSVFAERMGNNIHRLLGLFQVKISASNGIQYLDRKLIGLYLLLNQLAILIDYVLHAVTHM